MPRLTANRPVAAGAARPQQHRAAPRRVRQKTGAAPDRLSSRALFFRRVRRGLKPGLWLVAAVCAIFAGSEVFRAIPPIAPISPAGSLRHGFASLAADAGFRISHIVIKGAVTTKPDAVSAAMGVKIGDPLLGVSLTAIQARLLQLGPVQTATVERALPGTLIVTITERSATAIWQRMAPGGAAQFVLIDAHGNVIADQDAAGAKRRDPTLLLLAGADAPANAGTLLAELRAAPAVQLRVAGAARVDGLRWNLILRDQTLIKLPAENEAQAIAQLANLQASMALLDRPVEVIDLRLPGRMVIRPYPATTTASPART